MNIVVTGASKGIGLAVVERFASETNTTHSFAICSRSADEIRAVAERLSSKYPSHRFFAMACDVSDEQQVADFASMIDQKLGTADLIVNNAGFGLFKSVVDMSGEEFRSVLGANTRGVFLISRALLPAMRAAQAGTIITISSLAGKNGFAGGVAYCASKFAVRGFMQNLFLEVRTDNIRCITICPGSVDTDFFANIKSPGTTTKMLDESDVAQTVWFASNLPPSATISEIDIRPTNPTAKASQ